MAIYDSSKSKIYLKQYDLSAYTTSFEIGGGVGVRDVTTLADTSEASIIGPQSPTASWEGLFDETASGSDAVLAELNDGDVQPVTIWPTGIATKGNIGYGGDGRFANTTTKSSVGNAVSMSAEFNIGRMSRLSLLNTGLVTYTADYDAGDNYIDTISPPTTRGGAFFVHVTAISGTWTILLSTSSSTGSGYAALSSVGLTTITAVQGHTAVFTDTLKRYVDIDVTENVSGSLTMICGFARF